MVCAGDCTLWFRMRTATASRLRSWLTLVLLLPALRAEECIQAIEQTPHFEQAAAALRLLVQRRPAQTPEVLLAFAPFASENLESDLFDALAAVGLGADGKPAAPLLAALRDDNVA